MKSNSKEIKILCILLAILVVYGFYSMVVTPKLQEINDLDSQITADDMVVRGMYNTILSHETNFQKLKENVEIAQGLVDTFYVREQQETYLNLIHGLTKEEGVSISDITSVDNVLFEASGDYGAKDPYSVYHETTNAGNGTTEAGSSTTNKTSGAEEQAEVMPIVEIMNIQLDVAGKYSNVKALIDKIDNNEKHIYSDELQIEMEMDSIEKHDPNPQVRMSQTLSFMRLTEMATLNFDLSSVEYDFSYTPPQSFINNSYRNTFSLDNVWRSVQSVFH